MLSVGPILHCKVYAKFSSRGIIRGVSLYHHARFHECYSELDIEISSVEHVQFIVGFFSDIRQSKIAFEGVVYAKFSEKGDTPHGVHAK